MPEVQRQRDATGSVISLLQANPLEFAHIQSGILDVVITLYYQRMQIFTRPNT